MREALVGFWLAALVGPAFAQVRFYTNASRIAEQSGDASFDEMRTHDPLQNYLEDGLRLHVDDEALVDFEPPGINSPPFYYPDSGVRELIDITRIDASDFQMLEMNASHGFGGDTVFMWMQAYLDGHLLDEFNADVVGGTLIGLQGLFDQVKIGSYNDAGARNERNPLNMNAIVLDNVTFGTPEPAALALLGLGGMALLRHRR